MTFVTKQYNSLGAYFAHVPLPKCGRAKENTFQVRSQALRIFSQHLILLIVEGIFLIGVIISQSRTENKTLIKKIFFCVCVCFLGCIHSIWRFPGQELNWSYGQQPMPQAQQRQIQATTATYTTTHGNTRSLTH